MKNNNKYLVHQHCLQGFENDLLAGTDYSSFHLSASGAVCSIIHDHQTTARMFTPVTANSNPRKNFWEFTLGQGRAAWYKAAPTTGQVQQHRSLSPDHRGLTTLNLPARRLGHTWTPHTEAPPKCSHPRGAGGNDRCTPSLTRRRVQSSHFPRKPWGKRVL